MTPGSLEALVDEHLREACELLIELIGYESTPGREQVAMDYLAGCFKPLVDTIERIPFPDEFTQDPEYSSPLPGIEYAGRDNLKLVWNPGGSRTIILNAHVDVVPASQGQRQAFEGRMAAWQVLGRGACDDKGQVALIWLLLRVLNRLPSRPDLRLEVHLVNEEEVGGNGTLAMIRQCEPGRAEAAVVLEPTDGRVVTSVRGAVWFRFVFRGKSGHSGQAGVGVSALKNAVEAMQLLDAFHHDLLERSREIPLFSDHANPMPLTFGRLDAGRWPAMVPDKAVLEGVMGFLPNMTREEIIDGMRQCLERNGSPALAGSFELEVMYRHECHVIDPSHPLPSTLALICGECGRNEKFAAMPASCDSWFYDYFWGLPTVVFGAGSLADAHTADEKLSVNDLKGACLCLARFVSAWADSAVKS